MSLIVRLYPNFDLRDSHTIVHEFMLEQIQEQYQHSPHLLAMRREEEVHPISIPPFLQVLTDDPKMVTVSLTKFSI